MKAEPPPLPTISPVKRAEETKNPSVNPTKCASYEDSWLT
jgi:hypothetical protein